MRKKYRRYQKTNFLSFIHFGPLTLALILCYDEHVIKKSISLLVLVLPKVFNKSLGQQNWVC